MPIAKTGAAFGLAALTLASSLTLGAAANAAPTPAKETKASAPKVAADHPGFLPFIFDDGSSYLSGHPSGVSSSQTPQEAYANPALEWAKFPKIGEQGSIVFENGECLWVLPTGNWYMPEGAFQKAPCRQGDARQQFAVAEDGTLSTPALGLRGLTTVGWTGGGGQHITALSMRQGVQTVFRLTPKRLSAEATSVDVYDRTASLKGYAKPGSLVQVTGGTTNKSARADADTGEWTMNVRNLDLGANKFSLESFDDANESLGTSEFTVDVKTTPLSASVKSTSLAAQTAEVEITGTPGLTVQYQNKTKTLGHDGTATVTVDGLSLGKNTVTFQQFEGGQQVEADLDFDIMVTINKITAEAAFDTRGTAFDAVLSGTAEANAKVTIVDGKGKVTTTYANPRGAWTTPVKAPDSGRQTFEVTQSINSSDGGSTDVTLDYGNGVEVTAPRNDSDFAGGTLTFRGDGQYQAGVEIFEKGNDTALASTVGLNNGTWAAQVAGVDGELKHTYTVVQKSKGNLTTSETVVVNGDKPETPPAGTEVVLTNPAKASDGYVPNQAFTFRGTAKPEATITIQNTKGLVFGTATANATTGEWAFTYANMKEYTYSLDFIADKGTTTEKKTELRNFAPKEATGTEVVLTNPANASDGYVPNQAFTFRGTAKPEATVTIQNTKGLVFGTATATATTGEWAFTYANMKEYTYSLDFIADKGTTTEKKTELRNFAPNQMSTSLTNPANPSDGYAKNQSFTFTGTAKTGATVTIQNTKGLVFGTAKATVAGVWEFTVANMKDYVYSLDFIADKGGQNEETVELRGFAPRP